MKTTQMKTVLITGVSKGIGRALAEKFLNEGFKVIGTSTTGKVDYSHQALSIHQLELTSPESIDKCCADIQRLETVINAPIDILINNAGAIFDDDETTVLVDKLRKTLEVNLIGTIDFTEHILPVIHNSGHIINMTSSAGSLTNTDMKDAETSHLPFHYPAYKIAKCALNMYTRTLAMRMQHREKNTIVVSSVNPGWVKTDMGGSDAEITPEEAAGHIYKLAISRPETGQFWFEDKNFPW